MVNGLVILEDEMQMMQQRYLQEMANRQAAQQGNVSKKQKSKPVLHSLIYLNSDQVNVSKRQKLQPQYNSI